VQFPINPPTRYVKHVGRSQGRLVQLTADNMNLSIDCSVVPLHIPTNTGIKKSEDGSLRASAGHDSVSDDQLIHVTIPLTVHRSNGFAGSIAGAVLEAPSAELKTKSIEIPDSIPIMFVRQRKLPRSSPRVFDQLSQPLPGCGRSSLPFNLLHQLRVGREHYQYRFACVATNMKDLITRLEERIRVRLPVSPGNARRIPTDKALNIKVWIAIWPSTIPVFNTKHLH
jgi:hypothetical protein